MTQEIASVLPEPVPLRESGGRESRRKWPLSATLGFILLTCGSFWLAVSFGLFRAL